MNKKETIALLTDWRVATLIILVYFPSLPYIRILTTRDI
jgi:hypothetical protein